MCMRRQKRESRNHAGQWQAMGRFVYEGQDREQELIIKTTVSPRAFVVGMAATLL